ncbi:hypothetical protein F4780DRAFT_753016 [Xylariomycetidae sp. FL0641]|nr:hypothetical protein F4780DRAFT_753016 [Xylariomycetidae sp. FL0641]
MKMALAGNTSTGLAALLLSSIQMTNTQPYQAIIPHCIWQAWSASRGGPLKRRTGSPRSKCNRARKSCSFILHKSESRPYTQVLPELERNRSRGMVFCQVCF